MKLQKPFLSGKLMQCNNNLRSSFHDIPLHVQESGAYMKFEFHYLVAFKGRDFKKGVYVDLKKTQCLLPV